MNCQTSIPGVIGLRKVNFATSPCCVKMFGPSLPLPGESTVVILSIAVGCGSTLCWWYKLWVMQPADRFDLTSMCSEQVSKLSEAMQQIFTSCAMDLAKTGGHRCLKMFLDFSSGACASSASSYKDCHIMLSMHIHLEIMHHTVTQIVRTVLQKKPES